jgi:hypothetical protein
MTRTFSNQIGTETMEASAESGKAEQVSCGLSMTQAYILWCLGIKPLVCR